MNKKDKTIFNELKKKLTISLLNKERGIRIFDYIKKLQFSGKALTISQSMQEKCKLINENSYIQVRKARFLMGLKK